LNIHTGTEQDQAKNVQLLASFIHELNITRRHLQTYPPGHPIIDKACDKLLDLLDPLFRRFQNISLGVAKNALLFEHKWLEKSDPRVCDLATALSQRGIAAVHFGSQPDKTEILKLAGLINLDPKKIIARGGLPQILPKLKLDKIEITPVDYSLFRTADQEDQDEEQIAEKMWEDFLSRLLEGTLTDQPLTKLDPKAIAEILNRNYAQSQDHDSINYDQAIANFVHQMLTAKTASSGQLFAQLLENLTPELRRQFLSSAFRYLDNDPSVSEESLQTLPAELLEQALEEFNQNHLNISTTMVNLISTLDQHYQTQGQIGIFAEDEKDELSEQLKTLFREEDRGKFTPESYQGTLDAISLQTHEFKLDTEEAAQLRQQFSEVSTERHNCAITFNLLSSRNQQPESAQGLQHNLIDLAQLFLATGDFIGLSYLQQRLGQYLQQFPEESLSRTDMLQNYLNDPMFHQEILDNLSRWDEKKRQEINNYIKIAGASMAGSLIQRLGTEEDKSLRRTYLNTLAGLGKTAHEAIYQRLDDDRWFVIRNLLTILKMQKDPVDLERIKHLQDFPHLRVNQEYLQLLFKFDRGQANALLSKQLQCDDPQLRMHAVQLAEQSDDPATSQQLLKMLAADKLTDETLPQKQQIIRSLCGIGAENAFPTLQRLLKPCLLFTSKRRIELQKEIVRNLNKFPAPMVTPMLQKLANSRRKGLNSLAAEKLRQVSRKQT